MAVRGFLLASAAALLILPLNITPADAGERAGKGFARVNGAGGVTAGQFRGFRTNQGTGRFRARGVATDGAGTGVGGRGNCARGQSAAGCRGGALYVGEDGTIIRERRARGVTATGEANSSSSFLRNPDGTFSGNRVTSANGARGVFDAETTVDSENGFRRSVQANGDNGTFGAETTADSENGFRRSVGANGDNGTFDATTEIDPETGLNRSVLGTNENGSVAIESTFNKDEGGSRTVTCTDASGQSIACPSR